MQEIDDPYYVKDKHQYTVDSGTGIIEIYDITLTDTYDGKEIASRTRCLASRVLSLPKPEYLHRVWSIHFCEMNSNLVILYSKDYERERRLWSQVLSGSNSNTPGNPYESSVSNGSLYAASSELTGNIFLFNLVAGAGIFIEFKELNSNGHDIIRTVCEPWNRINRVHFSDLSFLLCMYHGADMIMLDLDCEEETKTLRTRAIPNYAYQQFYYRYRNRSRPMSFGAYPMYHILSSGNREGGARRHNLSIPGPIPDRWRSVMSV